MEGVKFVNVETNPTLKSPKEFYEIPFFKDKYYFTNIDNYVKFIKATEKMIRTSDSYTKFISEIKSMNLTSCQVLGQIHEEENCKVSIEMHHGPMFTLFDYCGIVIDHLLQTEKFPEITTYDIADIVLEEHWDGTIQTVMLSKTAHQLVDSGKMFINLQQARGDVNRFILKYRKGIRDDQMEKINKYIDLSAKYGSFDNNLLDLAKTVKDWSKRTYY